MSEPLIPAINLDEYNYHLPNEKIADFPESKRNFSKLLFADVINKKIEYYKFNDIINLLPENTSLVINSTKVIAARIFMEKPTGGKAEILCTNPLEPSVDPQIVMQNKKNCVWDCIIGGKRIKEGMILINKDNDFTAKIIKRYDNKAIVKFEWDDNKTFGEILSEMGKIPLPPYIRRDTQDLDKERYQTIYAKAQGSVAAPTAGLHFTDNIIEDIKNNGININEVILHVGPGTFVPISEDVNNHHMHKERIFIDINTLTNIYKDIKSKKKIIATGTTSVRTLESLFWAGQKIYSFGRIELNNKFINQWDPYYSYEKKINAVESLETLIEYLDKNEIKLLSGETSLFIVPGYDFKIINGMITNFHLPKSTLILLVAAFTGKDLWRYIYSSAIENNFRFLSYGDSSLLLK